MDPLADFRMFELHHVTPFGEMRIFREVLVAHGRKRRDAHRLQDSRGFPPIARLGPRRDDFVERRLVLFAQRRGLESRIARQLFDDTFTLCTGV